MSNPDKRLEVVHVRPSELKPNAYNPNRQSDVEFELLLRSMEEDGFTQPILAQAGSQIIVDGEHRWRAATVLGLARIPVVFVEMSEEQMRVATLRHNRARGSEDMRYVADVFKELQELGGLEWAQDSLLLDDLAVSALVEMPPLEDLVDEVTREAMQELSHSTYSVAEVQAVRTVEQKEATRQRERDNAVINRESKVFNLRLRFTREEGALIRQVVGKKSSAVWLLEMEAKYG